MCRPRRTVDLLPLMLAICCGCATSSCGKTDNRTDDRVTQGHAASNVSGVAEATDLQSQSAKAAADAEMAGVSPCEIAWSASKKLIEQAGADVLLWQELVRALDAWSKTFGDAQRLVLVGVALPPNGRRAERAAWSIAEAAMKACDASAQGFSAATSTVASAWRGAASMLEAAGPEYLDAWQQASLAADRWSQIQASADAIGQALQAATDGSAGLGDALHAADAEARSGGPFFVAPVQRREAAAVKLGELSAALKTSTEAAAATAEAVRQAAEPTRSARVSCRGFWSPGPWNEQPATNESVIAEVPLAASTPQTATAGARDVDGGGPAGSAPTSDGPGASAAPSDASTGVLPNIQRWAGVAGDSVGAEEFIAQGRALQEGDRYAAALHAYEQAATLDPSRAIPFSASAYIFLKIGRTADALAATMEALRREPEMPTHWMRLGDVYVAMEDTSRALAAYDRALSYDATNTAVMLRKGDLLWKLGNQDAARAAWVPACAHGSQAACRRGEEGVP